MKKEEIYNDLIRQLFLFFVENKKEIINQYTYKEIKKLRSQILNDLKNMIDDLKMEKTK